MEEENEQLGRFQDNGSGWFTTWSDSVKPNFFYCIQFLTGSPFFILTFNFEEKNVLI